MRVLKVYLDTSVIGGCFDEEFSTESLMLIDRIKNGRYIALISDTTLKELEGAPVEIRSILKVVPQWCQVDALHIATAAHFGADLLLSWNFKHIVNVGRIMGFNGINVREGYRSLEIRSPKEVVYDEEEI